MCYTGSEYISCTTIDHPSLTDWLDDYLLTEIPWNLRHEVTISILDHSNLNLYHIYSQSEHKDAVKFYPTIARPDTIDWEQA